MTDADAPVHLAWVFPGFGVGGAQVRFTALANALGARCRHSVIALNGDTACRAALSPGVEVRYPMAGHKQGRMAAAVLHARGVLAGLRPDCVVTSNWGSIEWAAGARLAGLRLVHAEDGFGPEERSTQIRRRVLTRRVVLRGVPVVLPSRTLLGIARDVWRLRARDLHYTPNGINLDRFADAAPMPPPPGEGPVIGTIAALRPEKNLGRLVRAFAGLRARRPARLVVVGEGPERPGLEALAAAIGVTADVHLVGHSAEPERWMASFDVFALSSDTEQMPLSLIEAMAAGRPVLCTDVGDVRAMLPSLQAGFVTPAEDAAFADGLLRLLEADGQALGAANRAAAKDSFGFEAMLAGWSRKGLLL